MVWESGQGSHARSGGRTLREIPVGAQVLREPVHARPGQGILVIACARAMLKKEDYPVLITNARAPLPVVAFAANGDVDVVSRATFNSYLLNGLRS